MALLKKFERKFQKSARYQRLTQGIFAWYVGLVLRSTRWTYVGFQAAEADIAKGIPRVFCAWHSRLALMPYFRRWDDHRMTAIGSTHADAQIAMAYLQKNGINSLHFQTSGSKTGPLWAAVKELRNGGSLGLTPDGPFGPSRVVQPGAIMIASLAKKRVSAVAYSTRRRFTVRSWDRFVIPLPFGRGVFVMADGFIPPPRMDAAQMQAAQDELTKLLDAVTAEADRIVAA